MDGQKLDEVVLDLGETRCVIFSGVDPSDRQRVALSYLDGDYDEAKSIVDFQTNRTVSLGKNTQSLSFHPWGNSFSPSGELLFASRTSIDGSSEKRSIGIYNTLSGELVGEIPYGPISTRHIRWRDSNTIVGFRSGEVSTYEVDSGTISTTHALELPEGKPSLSLSPDGSRVAVYDWQQQGMLEVLVYDCADGRLVSAIEHELPQEYVVLDVLWSPDGGMLAINVGLLDLAACG